MRHPSDTGNSRDDSAQGFYESCRFALASGEIRGAFRNQAQITDLVHERLDAMVLQKALV